ncbi:copper transporter [Nocardia stercoris]|uniref:Copper transporter n=1 Tax=Nocardia stercoris TaxID=2483361 RepID=A0A3M2KT70_9NOCA|nr:copper transporter [Nocardia stercoris]RMI27866.1 copper transporter [Nocardia stercoris]
MISLRQHAVSIAAIFLALAIGLVLGAHSFGAGLLSSLRNDRAQQATIDRLTAQNASLSAQSDAGDSFIAHSAGRILGGTLAEHSVLVFSTPDAEAADVEAVSKDLTTAGAAVTGRIALAAPFLDSGEGDRLRTAVTNMIPAGAQLSTSAVDQGSIAGDLLGLSLLNDPANGQPRATGQERGLILDTLRGGGFLTTTGDIQPAQLAVVITGPAAKADESGQGSIVARFAGALRARGAGVVLAGREGAAADDGAIAVVRSDPQLSAALTTVDNVDREIGRVTTALGLSEQLAGVTGNYGTGAKAGALTVAALPH